ncbi:sigma-54-dependent Fis family transcriptional regulator [Glaciimonas sp. PAMC28666]|uniref:sigma-54-dependent Fis family transcriptional regulator n=1 Tax=Glaciimonas sp. PAMC28666 TaxID=2807626 RepID=UPI001963CBD7|nr:sigma 54-interacting transcriptional regulator [Glaciimonas sp. PAMC28666]QRX82272.1 sigma-54-dependent Fis family transcriptional regulator [Glaciimonas sp. PAMC28666]
MSIKVAEIQRRNNFIHYPGLEELGDDAQMRDTIEKGKRLIDCAIPILILGETGTGKEYLSRALHAYSARRQASCVTVNCASIPDSLAESELFGYCGGAFSGALPGGMKGKVQQADGGTLFLDEIGDMPIALQTRLLRVLSEREVMPLGAAQPVHVDLHLISATHQNLHELVAAGRFREDLYYRIAGGVLRLPALRNRTDRRELILQMVRGELPLNRSPEQSISPPALERLLSYSWPGNLRQMHAVIRFACAVMNGSQIQIKDLPEELIPLVPSVQPERIRGSVPGGYGHNLGQTDASIALTVPPTGHPHHDERSRVLDALNVCRWNISAASRQLGMCRASLYRKLRQLEIPHMRDQAKFAPGQAVIFPLECLASNQPEYMR